MDAYDDLIQRYPDLTGCLADIRHMAGVMKAAYHQDGKLLVCGNGGSAADSEHIVGELMKGYRLPRTVPAELRQRLVKAWPDEGDYLADHLQGALPAISLVSQTALMTAFMNDVDPAMLFAQQVYGYGRPGDVILGLSTSGNSPNVIHAMRVGQALGLHCIGLTGSAGGVMPAVCEVTVRVPYERTSDIQERHFAIYHALCADLEEEFFSSNL
jgi:phosphoheptose isomerase